MRLFFFTAFLLASLFATAQGKTTATDSVSSKTCNLALHAAYKKKFEGINKSIASETSAQKNIIKGLYTEIQDTFLEKINHNNFICDSPVALYLEGLMDEILVKNKIGAESYKILLSRDSDANAYNTGDGTVVVNYGLFLIADNEDELVSVIAHEIGHQHLGHVRNDIAAFARLSTSEAILKKTKEIRSQKYGKATKAVDLLKSISYQNYDVRRKKEFQADSIGLAFYKKTLRNPKAAITILEKLDLSDTEKDSLTIADYKFIFEKNGFRVKERYFEQEESLFKKYDGEKRINTDSLKSHPDCTARIKVVRDYLHNNFPETVSSSAAFSEIKQMSIYQNLLHLYLGEEYGMSLYEALKLYKKDAENPALKNIICLNLSKIASARTAYTINRYVPKIDNNGNTDSLNRFISFINNIKVTDFETLINNFKS